MIWLALIPGFGVTAQLWVSWTRRDRRAPGVEQTIGQHQRALAAMSTGLPSHSTD